MYPNILDIDCYHHNFYQILSPFLIFGAINPENVMPAFLVVILEDPNITFASFAVVFIYPDTVVPLSVPVAPDKYKTYSPVPPDMSVIASVHRFTVS